VAFNPATVGREVRTSVFSFAPTLKKRKKRQNGGEEQFQSVPPALGTNYTFRCTDIHCTNSNSKSLGNERTSVEAIGTVTYISSLTDNDLTLQAVSTRQIQDKIVDLLASKMNRFPWAQAFKRLENGSQIWVWDGRERRQGRTLVGRVGTLDGWAGTTDGKVGILDGMTGTMDGRIRTLERAPGEMMGKTVGKRAGGVGGVGGAGGAGGAGRVQGNCLAIGSYALGSPARLSGPWVSRYHHITAEHKRTHLWQWRARWRQRAR